MKKILILALVLLASPAWAFSGTNQFIQNFTTGNQVNNTSITTTASAAALMTSNPNFQDVLVVNNGSVGVQLAFGGSGVVAVNTASAAGTNQTYIPAGAVMVISRNSNNYYSAITDTGTGSLIIQVGAGS